MATCACWDSSCFSGSVFVAVIVLAHKQPSTAQSASLKKNLKNFFLDLQVTLTRTGSGSNVLAFYTVRYKCVYTIKSIFIRNIYLLIPAWWWTEMIIDCDWFVGARWPGFRSWLQKLQISCDFPTHKHTHTYFWSFLAENDLQLSESGSESDDDWEQRDLRHTPCHRTERWDHQDLPNHRHCDMGI